MRTFPVTALTSAQLTPSSPAARPSAPAPAPRARPRRTGASARGAGVFRCSRTDTGRRLAPRASGGSAVVDDDGDVRGLADEPQGRASRDGRRAGDLTVAG